MKKIIAVIILVMFILTILSIGTVFANNSEINQVVQQTDNINNMKNTITKDVDSYTEKYGSESYGKTAYILNKVRIYSIPFCFLGIAIGAICEYALGTRRLDMKQKGFNLIITFVTILVICQVLPLIFAIVTVGWRG